MTREQLMEILVSSFNACCKEEIDKHAYEMILRDLCDKHGTEYVAECMLELTRTGRL